MCGDEKADEKFGRLFEGINEVRTTLDEQSARLSSVIDTPGGMRDSSDIRSESSAFLSEEDVASYVVPTEEAKDFLEARGYPLSEKFALPGEWSLVRDADNLLSISVPELGVLSVSLFSV